MSLHNIVTDETVTPEWLNAKLGTTTIDSIKVQRIGEDVGHTDLVYRVHLTHKNDDTAQPTGTKLDTIVMKVLDASTGHRTAFEPLNTREVRFYSEIAPLLNLESIPKCYYAHFDKETLKGNILLEDAGKPIHKGSLESATATQAKKTMAELGKLHGMSLAKSADIPTDMPRPLEPNHEDVREAFPAFAKTWEPFLGEEVLKRYERAVDAYENKWLVQKDGFVQGLVHGDYRIGNIIFGREALEDSAQDQAGQQDAKDFAENIKASVAQRHLPKPESHADAVPASREATSNGRVEDAAGDNTAGVPINGNASHPETAPENPVNSSDDPKPHSTQPPSSDDDISKLKFRHVDWQTVSRGPVFADVAYFLSISVDSATRQACEVDLLYAWYTACREAAGKFFPADLNLSRCVHEISVACIKAVVVSVTHLNHVKAPEMAMRMLGRRLNMMSQILVDWRSFD